MDKVTHISSVKSRKAQDIIDTLEIRQEDSYHVSIMKGAKALAAAGHGDYKYRGQYQSGNCYWEDPEGNTVKTLFSGEIEVD